MNSSLKQTLSFCGLTLLSLSVLAKSDLTTPEQRRDSVNRAVALTQPAPPVPVPADGRNPFLPPQEKQAATQTRRALSGDHEILAAIAGRIVPSGVMQDLDGHPILLLREKKLKVGDYLTITFEGTDYMIELAAIDHSSFTLRLNKEEITQPLN